MVRLLDAFLYRVLKLQDAVGERLRPATLVAWSEPADDRPMRDRLDRWSAHALLDCADAWPIKLVAAAGPPHPG